MNILQYLNAVPKALSVRALVVVVRAAVAFIKTLNYTRLTLILIRFMSYMIQRYSVHGRLAHFSTYSQQVCLVQ